VDEAVRDARDILRSLKDEDPETALRSLKLRRRLYEKERRDPALVALLDKAISLLVTHGHLDDLTPDEHATLLSHTCTTPPRAAE
jgi:hypothetical protein